MHPIVHQGFNPQYLQCKYYKILLFYSDIEDWSDGCWKFNCAITGI